MSSVDRRSLLAIREYIRIWTSDSIDPTSANGHTGIPTYSPPPMTATTVGPMTAAPATTTRSSAPHTASAIGTMRRRPCSLANRGSTRMATACGSQYAILATIAPTAYSPASCAGR